MSTKSLALTAAGLKNITTEAANKEFKFIFGQQEISMENIFADFISPKVSKIHKSDPTINSISFLNDIKGVTITSRFFWTWLKYDLEKKSSLSHSLLDLLK